MPNHVTNFIELIGDEEKIAELKERFKQDGYGLGTLDFNKIIPMPEALKIECGSRQHNGMKKYIDFVKKYTDDIHAHGITGEVERRYLEEYPGGIDPEEWELGKKSFNNLVLYGADTWYDWSCNNWGTKWNAYGYDTGVDYNVGNKLWFETAWCAPIPILFALSKMYPDIKFVHEFASEDMGCHVGICTYFGGELIDEYIPIDEEADELAGRLWGATWD